MGQRRAVGERHERWPHLAQRRSRRRKDHSLSLVQTARLFALLTASIHDSVQTSQTSKFVYRLWRPVTAVADAANDNNPATDSTPPPGSPSTMDAVVGHSAVPLALKQYDLHRRRCLARMLRNVFGADNKPFTATWYASNTVTPPATTPPVVYSEAYNSFWALAINEGNSRIWGGIHFRFEIDDSLESCADVADYIYDTKMQQRGSIISNRRCALFATACDARLRRGAECTAPRSSVVATRRTGRIDSLLPAVQQAVGCSEHTAVAERAPH